MARTDVYYHPAVEKIVFIDRIIVEKAAIPMWKKTQDIARSEIPGFW